MSKSKKENKGMIIVFIGFLFSILGMTILKENEYGNLSVIFSALGVLIIVLGLFKIVKANRENKDNF